MSANSVHIFNNIAQEGLDIIQQNELDISKDLLSSRAILLRSHSLHQVKVARELRVIARAGAGTNNIPVDRMTEQGVIVLNTPGANANAVKELVISCFVMASRNIFSAVNFIQDLAENDLDRIEDIKKQFKGFELHGKTLGVIGLGAIGSLVANAAIDLGLEVRGYDPMLTIERALHLSSKIEAVGSIQECVGQCDFITLHAPLIKDTTSLINREVISWMQPGAILLNFARDELVDSAAVKSALINRDLGMYVSDFPNRELLGTQNCHFLPHLGASTKESEINCAIQAAQQLCDFLKNGHIKNSVNFPEIKLARQSNTYRLMILNKNVPGALSDVMQAVANDRLNVIDMINQSKKEVAATLIDTDKPINPELIRLINDIDSVIRCYTI